MLERTVVLSTNRLHTAWYCARLQAEESDVGRLQVKLDGAQHGHVHKSWMLSADYQIDR